MNDPVTERAVPVTGWRPIATAPRDGTDVLLVWQYTYGEDKSPTVGVILAHYDDGRWCDVEGPHPDSIFTLWQPVPEAQVTSHAVLSPHDGEKP